MQTGPASMFGPMEGIFDESQGAPGEGGAGAAYGRFRNPWRDYASRLMPRNVKNALRLAEFLWYANPTYSRASSLIARYFITELEFGLKDDEKITDYKQLFYDTLDIVTLLSSVGDDFMCYGNTFTSIILPFDRNLQCPKSGNMFKLEEAFDKGLVEWSGFKFAKTSKGVKACGGSKADFRISDIPSSDVNRLIIKRWSPHEIEIATEPFTGKKVYYWNISSDVKKRVSEGNVSTLAVVPQAVIEAVKDQGKFKFLDGQMFHRADESVSGVFDGGWGIPSVIKVFRLLYRSQLLDRYDEAINLDYIAGLRVISPRMGGTNTGSDPIKHMGMDVFSGHVRRMIDRHRVDPTTWHTSPTPLEYQHMGADGAQLTPVDLKKEVDDKVLNAIGIPAELFRMSLTTEAAPLALRLFEQTWPQMQSLYNGFLNWLSDSLSKNFKYNQASIKLTKPTLVDDITIRDIMLQLMGGQQVSPQTALKRLGIGDYREEIRKTLEAERVRTEEQQKFDEQMAKEQKFQEFKDELTAKDQPQGAPPGGAAPAGGGMPPGSSGPMTAQQLVPDPNALNSPAALESEGLRIAQQLLTMDPAARRTTITNLTKSYSTLAGVVKEQIRKMEQQAAQTGKNLMRTGQIPPPQI